jgi:hypothetical protein
VYHLAATLHCRYSKDYSLTFPALKIFVEEVDPHSNINLGPNLKIRNMSRPYREAKSDIIWIIDSNVGSEKMLLGGWHPRCADMVNMG